MLLLSSPNKLLELKVEIINVDYNKPLLMYVHYLPYIKVTYSTSHYLLRISFKSGENKIFFNDELCKNMSGSYELLPAQRYEHAAL